MAAERYASIATMAKAMFRMVESGSAPQLSQRNVSRMSANLREEIASSAHADPVMRFLLEMDRKLDTILGYLQRDSLTEQFPLEGRVVQISGDAIILECKEPLAPGDYMELLVVLEEYPLRTVSIVAKVESLYRENVMTGAENTAFCLSYAHVSVEDREAVIRFVFSEERRRIRLQKSE